MNDCPEDKLTSPFAPADSPAAIAHLNMLQAIITRLAGNSAQCKTWCLVIVSALFGFAGAMKNEKIVAAAIIPIVIFGLVDAAYLANERAVRGLYDSITTKIRDRSYDIADCFDLSAGADRSHFFAALRSWSIWPIYLGMVAAYALARVSGLLTY